MKTFALALKPATLKLINLFFCPNHVQVELDAILTKLSLDEISFEEAQSAIYDCAAKSCFQMEKNDIEAIIAGIKESYDALPMRVKVAEINAFLDLKTGNRGLIPGSQVIHYITRSGNCVVATNSRIKLTVMSRHEIVQQKWMIVGKKGALTPITSAFDIKPKIKLCKKQGAPIFRALEVYVGHVAISTTRLKCSVHFITSSKQFKLLEY